eukprot:2643389-Lingulodinium_polyedra.AAC.1
MSSRYKDALLDAKVSLTTALAERVASEGKEGGVGDVEGPLAVRSDFDASANWEARSSRVWGHGL